MKTKITETIELTISYSTDSEDDQIGLLDLRDVLTEGALTYLPFGGDDPSWEIDRASIAYERKEKP